MLVRYTKFPKGEFAHSRFGELERERRLLLRAKQQQVHRQMLYLAMRISMESGIRIGSLRKMRWGHISENKTLSKEDQQIWCLVEVPAENTKTGRIKEYVYKQATSATKKIAELAEQEHLILTVATDDAIHHLSN